MLEAMTTEMLLTGGNVVVGALSVAASVVMLRSPRKGGKEVDVDALVRDAPYHLLQNVISAQRAPCCAWHGGSSLTPRGPENVASVDHDEDRS